MQISNGGRVQWLWPLGWLAGWPPCVFSFFALFSPFHPPLSPPLYRSPSLGSALSMHARLLWPMLARSSYAYGHSTRQNSPLLFICRRLPAAWSYMEWNETLIAIAWPPWSSISMPLLPFTASQVLYKTACSNLVFFTLHGGQKKGSFYRVCLHLQGQRNFHLHDRM